MRVQLRSKMRTQVASVRVQVRHKKGTGRHSEWVLRWAGDADLYRTERREGVGRPWGGAGL